MNLSWCFLLLLVVFAVELALAAVIDDAVQFDPKDIKMTIKSRNGEIIDCVDIYKQPSLDNPLLKDMKHQPARWLSIEQQDGDTQAAAVEQEWNKGTRQCPIGKKDNNPRLNIFYTPDDGKTLCYNLNCGGFVQTSRAVALGASLVNGASGVDDPVPYLLVSIQKSPAGPWHVLVNDTDLGYYPRAIFPWWMFPEAVANLVGGTVLNTWPGGKHTGTVMGNGRRPPGDPKPAVIKGYVAVDLDGHPFPETLQIILHTAPTCYDAKFFRQSNGSVGASVAFGGSGGPDCAPRPA
ncbi:hypothetical protein VPH35_042222 [Triticum aestivum]